MARKRSPSARYLLAAASALLALAVTRSTVAAAEAATAPPAAAKSVDEVRAAMQAKNWRAAASLIDKALFPAPSDAAARYELLMLKGECRLQLADGIGAASAFRSASRSAADLPQFAAAMGNALVIDRSVSGKFTPRGVSGAEPIDVVSAESRAEAMLVLRDEMRRQYGSQLEAARRAEQLPFIENVFKYAAEMYLLETCANGRATDAGTEARELGARAFGLMQDEVRKSEARLDQVAQIANSSGVDARGSDTGRMGLTSQQRVEVKRMIPYLVKIRDRATEYRRIAAKLGGDPGKWETLVADTVEAIGDAEALAVDR